MDFPYVKEALTKLFSKPSTNPYPFAPAPAKPNYRGRIVFHPDKCINCNMCERVCAGQAISHTSEPCEGGEMVTRQFYLGSCTFCGHCKDFCTHGAIELSDDYHMVADYYHAPSFEEGEEALIVTGKVFKKAPLKKAAAAAPVKPAAATAKPAPEAKPVEAAKPVEKAAPAPEEKPSRPGPAKVITAADLPAAAPVVKAAPVPEYDGKHARVITLADVTAAAAAAVEKQADKAVPAAPAEPAAPEKSEKQEARAEEAVAAPQPRDDGKPVQDPSKCVYCTLCARNCPMEALTVDRKAKTWELNEDACIGCGTCASACPKDAIIL